MKLIRMYVRFLSYLAESN